MELPYKENAIIQRIKITRYLLSLSHQNGRSKAKFFRGIGFNESNIEEFESLLLQLGKTNEVAEVDRTKEKIVVKYIIYGVVLAPNRKKYRIKTVWAIEVGSKTPHLATAHPSV